MKKIFIPIISAIVLVGAAVCTFFVVKNNQKSTTIAFYNLPQEISDALKEVITGTTEIDYKFIELSESELIEKKKKYNILFAYNDINTKLLMENAVEIPNSIIERTPSTIKSSSFFQDNSGTVKAMPVAIDIFQTNFLRTAFTKYEIPEPETFGDLIKFGRTSKFYYSVPFVTAGHEDINVNSLLSLLVASYGGYEGYCNVINKISNLSDFEQLYEIKIGGNADKDLTIASLLNIIKDWQTAGYLANEWTNLTTKQVVSLIDDNRIDLCFMNLSECRNITVPNIYYYNNVELQSETGIKNVRVQPVIVGLAFENTEAVRIALNRVSQEKNQEFISLKTKLGPAMLRGTSCDVQADDARYIAASTEGGPVPDLGTAALKTQEQRHLLAEIIRNYFN